MSPTINVFHIVWRPFGVGALENFLRSYQHNKSGCEHRLILLFKGFKNESLPPDYRAPLQGVKHERLFLADIGFDIGAYLQAVKVFPNDYYFFLNSRTMLLSDDWLAKIYSHASRENVGLAGATASWESLYTDHVRVHKFAPSARTSFRSVLRSSAINTVRHYYYYPAFPNPHIRSNAFMIRGEVLARIKVGRIKTRLDTSRFENGRHSLTRQVLRMRLDALAVGMNGRAYAQQEWPESGIFWQGNQDNLLVADNQTDKYSHAGAEQRAALTKLAWG